VTAAEARLQPLSRAGHRRPTKPTRGLPRALAAVPVAAILVMQAVMSFRLLHATGASSDEALYIYSGHQLIHELWHGGGSPYYETYFSGAPVVYPVLAAALDHVGGLALVRAVSGLFMLIATGLLFATARQLFGYWPAVTATGLFAALGITQGLGAYATFDALALMLIAFSAFCAVKAANNARWLLAVPVVLALANMTKYASVLFDPVVILLAAFIIRTEGWRRIWHRTAILTGVTVSLLTIAVLLAGTAYLHGVMFTTLARKTGTGILNIEPANSSTIVMYSWDQIGLLVLVGALAMMTALLLWRERPALPLLALFLVAGALVTMEALRLRDLTSVNKHDDFGAWFTAISAGYALARGVELVKAPYVRAAWGILALLSVPITFYFYGNHGPIAAGRKLDAASQIVQYLQVNSANRYLIGSRMDHVIAYDYHLPIPWWRLFDDDYVKYPIPGRGGNASGSTPGQVCTSLAPGCVYLRGPEGARAAIGAHWFAVISFIGQHYLPIDRVELETVRTTPGYLLVSTAGGPTYIYVPDFPGGEAG
jgi:hypothetical protein